MYLGIWSEFRRDINHIIVFSGLIISIILVCFFTDKDMLQMSDTEMTRHQICGQLILEGGVTYLPPKDLGIQSEYT